MNEYIFLAAIVIIACVAGNRVSNIFGVPMLLVFILLGMFFGSDGVIQIAFDNFDAAEQIFVSSTGLRGAVIVLFSILLQGTMLPYLASKQDFIDEKEDVLKTFTDYTQEVPIQFIEFPVKKNHPWAGSMVKDILLPPETLLVQIRQRGNRMITPDGSTVLHEGDRHW